MPVALDRRSFRDLVQSPRIMRARALPLDRIHRARNTFLLRSVANGRLHVGCGATRFEGWLNIDRSRTRAVDIRLDLRGGLPAPVGSVQFAHSEHLIEHLDRDLARRCLIDLRAAVRDDGVVRIATPDLGYIVDRYRGDWQDQAWLADPSYHHIAGPAEMLNVSMRAWGHRHLYDEDDLTRLLHNAGFSCVDRCSWGTSEHEELRDREIRPDSTLILEARR